MRLNTVSVSRAYHTPDKRRDAFVAGPLNWLSPARPVDPAAGLEAAAAAAAAAEGEGAGGSGSDGGSGDQQLLVKVRHGPNTARCALLLGGAASVAGWAARAGALAAAGDAANGGGGGGDGSGWRWRVEDILGADERPAAAGSAAGGEGGAQYGLVLLDENDQGLAAGQYAVFYQGGVCLGAAKILGPLGSGEAAEALAGAAAEEGVAL